MAMSEALLPEFDHEMATLRKTLERVPDDKFGWKPHQKSMSMGQLASHLAQIPAWATFTINTDSLDLAPPGGEPFKSQSAESRQQLLDILDRSVRDARHAIAGASDEHLLKPWTLLKSGNTILTMPRVACLRSFVMNHAIHHRAQLGVYLRLNDVPVPATYGPSADEQGM